MFDLECSIRKRRGEAGGEEARLASNGQTDASLDVLESFLLNVVGYPHPIKLLQRYTACLHEQSTSSSCHTVSASRTRRFMTSRADWQQQSSSSGCVAAPPSARSSACSCILCVISSGQTVHGWLTRLRQRQKRPRLRRDTLNSTDFP